MVEKRGVIIIHNASAVVQTSRSDAISLFSRDKQPQQQPDKLSRLCGQVVDNYEYELPSEFEDEEIDEDTAFTEEDKKLYAGWFEGTEAALAGSGKGAVEDGLLDSEDDGDGDEEGYNTDDFSAEVRLWPMPHVTHRAPHGHHGPHAAACALAAVIL